LSKFGVVVDVDLVIANDQFSLNGYSERVDLEESGVVLDEAFVKFGEELSCLEGDLFRKFKTLCDLVYYIIGNFRAWREEEFMNFGVLHLFNVHAALSR
jgi:hypothetical protein